MKDLEKLLESADFSRETTQKNQLYYEPFHKPVPVIENRPNLLGDFDLGLVNGGVRSMPMESPEAEGVIVRQIEQGAVVLVDAGQEQLVTEDMAPGIKSMRAGERIRFRR